MSLQSGTVVGRYEIVEPIGQGGMATVYKARQSALDRIVALKVIRAGFSEDPEFLERFRREARAVARLDHPNVVQVYDFDEVDGRAILAMQFLDGGGLKERVARLAGEQRLMAQDEVVRVIEQIAAGLAYAHAQGVIHRDVKPANVMFTHDGRAVVTDFGIARMLGGTQLTATGVGIGTPEYMSPEQGQGGELDARSDVYSLGVVAYELLSGRVPFSGDTPFAVVLKHVRDPLAPPSQVNPALTPAIDAVLMKALAKTPAERHGSVIELAAALRAAVGTRADVTLPTVVSPRPSPSASPIEARRSVPPNTETQRKASGALAVLVLGAIIAFDLGPRVAALDTGSLERLVPTPSPTVAPSPTPRPITFRAEQLIMPPEELPVSQYEVTTDRADEAQSSQSAWRRLFVPKTIREFGSIEFRLRVHEAGRSTRPTCEGWTWSGSQPTEVTPVEAATLGDRSILCRFRFSDGTRWLISIVAERNVGVETHLFARVNATDAAATELVISLAQRQIAIISRVAPR